jgi:hypothetical protein
MIRPAYFIYYSGSVKNFFRKFQMLESSHGIGPQRDRGPEIEKHRGFFKYLGVKTVTTKGDCGAQSSDPAADDRNLLH